MKVKASTPGARPKSAPSPRTCLSASFRPRRFDDLAGLLRPHPSRVSPGALVGFDSLGTSPTRQAHSVSGEEAPHGLGQGDDLLCAVPNETEVSRGVITPADLQGSLVESTVAAAFRCPLRQGSWPLRFLSLCDTEATLSDTLSGLAPRSIPVP